MLIRFIPAIREVFAFIDKVLDGVQNITESDAAIREVLNLPTQGHEVGAPGTQPQFDESDNVRSWGLSFVVAAAVVVAHLSATMSVSLSDESSACA